MTQQQPLDDTVYIRGLIRTDRGQFKDAGNQVFDVTFFGAKGDGVHDDYLAITRAIAASGGRGSIYFPAGVYITSQPITVSDTVAAPKSLRFIGDSSKSSWLLHTGSSTTGCLKFSGAAGWQAASSVYLMQNTMVVHIARMALGSITGPALTHYFCNKPYLDDVLFFSAGATYPYWLSQGTCQGTYRNVRDIGNDSVPSGVDSAAWIRPANLMIFEPGTYNDGTHGSAVGIALEHDFIGCRGDGYYSGHGVVLRSSGGASQVGLIKFIGGKFTSPSNIGATNYYAPFSIDGATNVSLAHVILEPLNVGGIQPSMALDNQNGDTEVSLDHVTSENAGYLDIGTQSWNGAAWVNNSSGSGKFLVRANHCAFYQARMNYAASTIKELQLNDVTSTAALLNGSTLRAAAFPNGTPFFRSTGNRVRAPGDTTATTAYADDYLALVSVGGEVVDLVAAGASVTSENIYKSSGTPTVPTNLSDAQVLHQLNLYPYFAGAYGNGHQTRWVVVSASAKTLKRIESLTVSGSLRDVMTVNTLGLELYGVLQLDNAQDPANVSNGSIFFDSTNSNKLSVKNLAGTTISLVP